MTKRTQFVALCLLLPFRLSAESSKGDVLIFTPDAEINRQIADRPISEIGLIRYDVINGQLLIDPQLPSHWTWVAGKVPYKGESVEFFFRNGILFANDVDICSFRTRKYPDSFTDRIKTNTFTVGMQKRDEAVIFVATEEPKDVHLAIDKTVFGEEKVFDFYLGSNGSQMIRIFRMKPPYRP